MSKDEPFSIAKRITKPIPLAALVVLVLEAIALAIIQAGEAHVGAIGYTIIAAVTLIATLALLIAFVRSKPADSSITTKGDYSPGDVGGDYLVSESQANEQEQAASRSKVSSTPLSEKSIETEGHHSPGRVNGNYTIHENKSD